MTDLQFIPVTTPARIDLVARMADAIWHQHYSTLLAPGQIDYMVEKFQSAEAITRQIASQGYEYYLLRAEKRDVGYIGIQPNDGKLFLSKLYIYADARGSGFGSLAFAYLEKLCRERGLSAIWLTVNRDNENTITVYRCKGFEVIRTQVVDIGHGFVMDDLVMEKPILPE